jgi:hypothetical protein
MDQMDQMSVEKKGLVATPWVFLTILGLLVTMLGACGIGRIFPDLSAGDLKKKIDEGTPLLIIDLRDADEYRKGRIPRAINVAPNQLHLLKNVLPDDKNTPIVFYCRGSG